MAFLPDLCRSGSATIQMKNPSNRIICILCLSCLVCHVCTGCAEKHTAEPVATMAQDTTSTEEAATAEHGTEPDTAIDGKMILDGIYDITVDSSSSMFQIVSCQLSVSMGEMTARMTMGGKGYLYLYMGTGAEAAKLSEREYIPFTEDTAQDAHVFTVPVEALDQSIPCAAFSKNKQKWYDRELVFRSDSLPVTAFDEILVPSVSSLGLTDGSYQVDVTLAGGSGRASVQSPAAITIQDGQATAEIIFNSPSYDYLMLDDRKYTSVIQDNCSVFRIPVQRFNHRIAISANTIAMSSPHEIAYTLYFDADTLVTS